MYQKSYKYFTILTIQLSNNNIPAKVSDDLKEEILKYFKSLLRMKNKGIDLFFTDIDKIKKQMLEELEILV